ncbi:PREDICTED: uncharacterized protein LOC109240077 [Nicotiana attenuata]|uniref:uncharacterized protein LOC109240077 n=1 Tax=Nicotiana attenuata TaxID=49451 RepID=UPI0009049CEE|nr:PREDICTED: uncharacterized protein LOC109240077 [Nicotiana attenuata]
MLKNEEKYAFLISYTRNCNNGASLWGMIREQLGAKRARFKPKRTKPKKSAFERHRQCLAPPVALETEAENWAAPWWAPGAGLGAVDAIFVLFCPEHGLFGPRPIQHV